MLSPAPEWIPELLELHAEELETLWNRRLLAHRSHGWTLGARAKLDARIAAHSDALVLAADEARALVDAQLASGELPATLAAAFVLLSREDPAGAERAHEAFEAAEGLTLEAFRQAFHHAAPERHRTVLDRLAASGSDAHASVALQALAFHGVAAQYDRVVALTRSRDPALRAQAWNTVTFLASASPTSPVYAGLRAALGASFTKGQADPDPAARGALHEAAAWTRQGWLLPRLRSMALEAQVDDLPQLFLLAALGTPEDLPTLQALASNPGLPAERIELLGVAGSPVGVPAVLEAMASADDALAISAARAFLDITGVDAMRPGRIAVRPSPDADDGLERVRLPDVAAARAAWQGNPRLSPAAATQVLSLRQLSRRACGPRQVVGSVQELVRLRVGD